MHCSLILDGVLVTTSFTVASLPIKGSTISQPGHFDDDDDDGDEDADNNAHRKKLSFRF